jgi:hypothetical protein
MSAERTIGQTLFISSVEAVKKKFPQITEVKQIKTGEGYPKGTLAYRFNLDDYYFVAAFFPGEGEKDSLLGSNTVQLIVPLARMSGDYSDTGNLEDLKRWWVNTKEGNLFDIEVGPDGNIALFKKDKFKGTITYQLDVWVGQIIRYAPMVIRRSKEIFSI